VDELQDANRVQLDFALALTGPAGNVTVVGDPDQGIYSFRGAVRGNVGRFEVAYPAMRRIVLRRNYRSLAPIIEASRRLVEHNALPGEPMPLRQVAHRRARRPASVRARAYWTAELEADAIAADIAGRIVDGARPSDFAVLMRSNSETDLVLRSLLVRGVAADNGARPDLIGLPAVRSLLAFLRVVADPTNNLELYTLAAAEPYSLAGEQLNPRLQTSRRRQRSLWESLLESAESGSRSETDLRARALVEHVRAGIAMSASHSTGEVLHDYLRRSGLLARLARMSDDGADLAGLRGIARFVQVIRARASLLAHDRVPFLVPHLERIVELDPFLDADGPRPEHVAVLTVHRAKGLEFKVVYLAGLVEGRFPVRSRPPLLALPPELVAGHDDEDALAEERRLFYVAMTRARDELWLSYHAMGPAGRGRRRPSPFVAEALDAPAPAQPGQLIPDSGGDVALIGRLLEPEPVAVPAAKPAGGALSLSFSQVDAYLSCPERYRLRYVVGLSTPAHHALAYGSALHQTIAAFHLRQGQGTPMTEAELLAEFAANWTPDGFLSREHEEARYQAGQDALRRFRIEQLASGRTPIAIERPFRFRLGQDQIVGRVDRLDRTPEGTVITDYKSSDVREQKRADTRARDSLQLQVYALAHEAESGELPARVQLHFLDSGVVGSATPDPVRLEKARKTLDAAASGIRSGNFVPRPSAMTCGYCPFREICPASAA
jgi:DNA helicase-2/ATP-dependent DNA helicase PcrA